MVKQLLNPAFSDRLLAQMGANSRLFDPLLHNTVSPTVLRASEKFNVIPSEVSVGLDGRLLPGYTPDNMLAELNGIVGPEVEFEVIRHDPGPADPDMGLFDTLVGILRQADPQGIPLPYVLSAITDARFFSKLGIQTYGFLPMQLPENFNFSQTIHTADERIPVEAMQFGSQMIFQALQLCGV
jgi:acetylornithine deacetylase/succinyl-diaminopimelate desuccinylase-like protein